MDDLLDLTGVGAGGVRLQFRGGGRPRPGRRGGGGQPPPHRPQGQSARLELAAGRPHVWADPARFQQAVWNLVRNAVKFTPVGGEITVRSRNEGGRLVVEVSDNGIGIESQYLDRIFQAFDQGDTSVTRQYGGVGLGLTIAKTLIDAHGGRLTARERRQGAGDDLHDHHADRGTPGRPPGR